MMITLGNGILLKGFPKSGGPNMGEINLGIDFVVFFCVFFVCAA